MDLHFSKGVLSPFFKKNRLCLKDEIHYDASSREILLGLPASEILIPYYLQFLQF